MVLLTGELTGGGATEKEHLRYIVANLFFLNFLSPSVGDPFGPISGYTAINGS
jgi:hypothetical protein